MKRGKLLVVVVVALAIFVGYAVYVYVESSKTGVTIVVPRGKENHDTHHSFEWWHWIF